MKKVQIITDGSCIGNPGPGGWACILRDGSDERELSGSEALTTNNRMELTAAINGLRALHESSEVELVTDSQYLKQGITEFLARWKTNGWRTSNRKPVQNQDLWRALDELVSEHTVRWPGLLATANMTSRIGAMPWRLVQRGDKLLPDAPPVNEHEVEARSRRRASQVRLG